MVILGIGMVFLAVAGGVAWRFMSGHPDVPANRTASVPGDAGANRPGTGEASADRPGETVQALAADQETLKSRIDGISENVAYGIGGLSDQLLRIGEELTFLKTEQAAMAETDGMQTRIDQLRGEMLTSMQAMIDEFGNRADADYPVDGRIHPDRGRGVPGQDGLLWYSAANPDPIDGPASVGGLAALQDRFASLSGSDPLSLARADAIVPEPLPVYTIPSDATLVRSRSLTALIGRVPLQGQVVEPFPFKVVTGRDNLLAGGQVLPELEQAIWSGTATGDATLHCVTGQLNQVTFIFRDGSISTWPVGGGGGSAENSAGRLGWISNEQGYPCIPGQFVSNLKENIGKITSTSFASGLARAWSEQQATTIREGGAVTRSFTGNPGEYALGQGIAGGIDEWARIVAERARDAFDAVVVSPGQTLTVHVNRSIPVDWPPEGRRIRHVSPLSAIDPGKKPGGLD